MSYERRGFDQCGRCGTVGEAGFTCAPCAFDDEIVAGMLATIEFFSPERKVVDQVICGLCSPPNSFRSGSGLFTMGDEPNRKRTSWPPCKSCQGRGTVDNVTLFVEYISQSLPGRVSEVERRPDGSVWRVEVLDEDGSTLTYKAPWLFSRGRLFKCPKIPRGCTGKMMPRLSRGVLTGPRLHDRFVDGVCDVCGFMYPLDMRGNGAAKFEGAGEPVGLPYFLLDRRADGARAFGTGNRGASDEVRLVLGERRPFAAST